jgi:hypothetical protein
MNEYLLELVPNLTSGRKIPIVPGRVRVRKITRRLLVPAAWWKLFVFSSRLKLLYAVNLLSKQASISFATAAS